MKDLSVLFTYFAVDHSRDDGGHLGFVITHSVLKSRGAGDGFRAPRYTGASGLVSLRPLVVHDLSAMQVFEGATNRTAVMVVRK